MDRVISDLARYCHDLRFEDLPDAVVRAASERLVDTLGCAIGGLDCDAARIARRLAPQVQPTESVMAARWIGAATRTTTAEAAGYLNATMIRYLDFNDTFPGGHPSDALGPVIALADAIGSSGAELLTALVAGYDIFIRFAISAQLRERGWDQGYGIGLATAAGASMLLGLDYERTWHALSISAVSNVPLRATRAGQLSLWKGIATSYATRNALFGTLLAAEGITGPEAPIEGRHGLVELVSGPFELQPFTTAPESYLTRQARIKFWPVEYHLQAAVWAGIELGRQLDLDELETVEISTYWSCWHETGSEPEKWDPQTRETADHSMPYAFVRAFEAGELSLTAFEPEAYLAADVRVQMRKVSVRVEDELESLFPDKIVMRAVARTYDGRELRVEIVNPRGHEDNPVTEAEVNQKFGRLVEPVYGASRTGEILTGVWDVARAERFSDVLDLLVRDTEVVDDQGHDY
jgi:2-methylcitrate dehydratase